MKKWIEIKNTTKDLKTQKPLKVVSLFSGCGGKDLGMLGGFTIFGKYYGKNNFEIVFANDIIQHACDTYKNNFKDEILCEDIHNVDASSIPECDVVIGGFPCQDFSVAGLRKGFDNVERGQLYLEMKRIIDAKKPKFFVAENVEGLTNLNGSETLNTIKKDFSSSGYFVEAHLFNAADYEVPQARKRVIFIGIRNDLVKDEEIPYPMQVCGEGTNRPQMTAKEALDDIWDKIDKTTIPNHTIKDYSKAKFYPGGKGQGNCRIKANKPSPTIRSEHHGNIEGHYRTLDGLIDEPGSENVLRWRRLSVRECARLQTFPDTFIFPKSASSAYKEIGNAVPVVFAWYIFRAINLYFSN